VLVEPVAQALQLGELYEDEKKPVGQMEHEDPEMKAPGGQDALQRVFPEDVDGIKIRAPLFITEPTPGK
jgi:hypothetical protein